MLMASNLRGWAAMAYVPKAKRDIFISYPIEVEEWAQHFEQDLRKELEQLVPASELSIYLAKRDWQLAPSDEMLVEAAQSAFFIATLVPGALSQEGLRFFQQEWKAFGKTAEAFGSIETRFAPVLIKEVDARRLAQFFPPENSAAFWRGIEFYFKDKAGVPHTLARNSRNSIYRKKIVEVAWQVKQRLTQLKDQVAPGDKRNAGTAKGPFAGMKVVLGEQDMQLKSEWEEVRQLLLNDGVELVGGEYPDDDAGLQESLQHDIDRADLFVQLLNPMGEAARRVEAQAKGLTEDTKSRAHLCYECALAYHRSASRRFVILQWRDPKIIRGALRFWPEDLLDSAHVQAVGLQQFKQAIRATLEELRKPPKPVSSEKPFLFITADQADLDFAGRLSEAALDHADVDVLTDAEEDRKEHFTEAMRLAAAIIILHGKAPPQFVRNWLSMYVREKAKQKRTSRFDALYRAPPPKQSSEEPRLPSRDLRVLGSEELFTVAGIEQLCRELEGGR
jgi:hypothetical protein